MSDALPQQNREPDPALDAIHTPEHSLPVTQLLNRAHVLLVDDSEQDRELIIRALKRIATEVTITTVRDPGELAAALESDAFDIAITDYQLQWTTGRDVLRLLKQRHPQRPVIMFTASGSEEIAVASMKEGLDDYITKTARHYARLPYAAAAALERAHTRSRLQEVLHAQRQALELEVRRKNDFLATLAHELRNPLAPIRYASGLIKPDASPQVLAQAREMIERQAAQMARLLDDLLDFSRITRDLIELRREIVDLRRIVEEAVTAAAPVIDSMHHELHMRLSGEALWVDGDPVRLSQVVSNLLDNAAKYTNPGGRIEVCADEQDGYALVAVSDTGIGFPPEATERLFELFVQLHSGEYRRGGLGVGLAVVKKLVGLHGGTVIAESPGPQQGSRFTMRLPMAASPVGAASTHEPISDQVELSTSQRRILIVDDSPDIVDSLAMLLSAEGRSVHVAYGGREALRVAEALQPHIIVLDLGMPDVDGYQVARWIRQQPWGAAVYIVAVSGWGQEADRQRTKDAGIDHHVVKPVQPGVLMRLIDSIHTRRG